MLHICRAKHRQVQFSHLFNIWFAKAKFLLEKKRGKNYTRQSLSTADVVAPE
jgi:hypothetical protein